MPQTTKKTQVKRLEKYRKVYQLITGSNDRSEYNFKKSSTLEGIEINYEGEQKLFLDHLIKLLDSMKNRDKISKYIRGKEEIIEPYMSVLLTFYINDRKAIDYPEQNFVKQDIKNLAHILKIPELEVICDLILTVEEN